MIKHYFFQLPHEKRHLLSSSLLILTTLLLIALIASFTNQLVAHERQHFVQNQQTVQWLARYSPKLATLRNETLQKQPFQGQTPSSIIQNALKATELNLFKPELSVQDSNGLLLQFKTVPFNQLYLFLTRIWEGNQLFVKDLNIEQTPTSGLVQAKIVISRK